MGGDGSVRAPVPKQIARQHERLLPGDRLLELQTGRPRVAIANVMDYIRHDDPARSAPKFMLELEVREQLGVAEPLTDPVLDSFEQPQVRERCGASPS